jgi:drug/metabolite transporter (DMT)-like permease
MLLGAFIIVGKDFSSLALGDFLILAATFLSPFGNLYQKKTRELVSSETAMFLRSFLSTIIVAGFVVLSGESLELQGEWTVLVFLLINGVVIAGLSKLFFLEGIHRISVTKAILLHNLTPLLTLFFAWLLLAQAPTVWQISSLIPFILGVILLTANFRITQFRDPFDLK